jgi:signal peptidase II
VPALTALRKYAVPLMTAALLAAWDQATKAWVLRNLDLFEVRTVFPGWFDLVHVRNPGVAFSLLANLDPALVRPVLIAVTIAEIGALLCFIWFLPGRGPTPWGLGMILGGAAGNLVDRARFGYVVDFVDIYRGGLHWPTFNLADAGITVGILLLAAGMFFGSKESDAPRPAADR